MMKLQPLRVPPLWRVEYNKFFQVDPEVIFGRGDELTSTLFVAKNTAHNLSIDVGWYPDSDPDGRYIVTLYQGGNFYDTIGEFESRSRLEVVAAVEQWLMEISTRPIQS